MNGEVHNCPCCGAPLAKPVTLDAVPLMAKLNPQQAAIFSLVAAKPGEWVSRRAVIDELWGEDIDGGPSNIRSTLKVICSQMRPKLAALGLDVVRSGQTGQRPGWFRLAFVAPKGTGVVP